MYKQSHRIIFNKARGCLMAVAETAVSQGKGAVGERTGAEAAGNGVATSELCLAALGLACKWLAGAVWVWLPLSTGLPIQSQAQTVMTRIVSDTTAPRAQQATVLNSANGVVQVNIQTPSAAGVSRNTFSQFDVGNAGAVVNNSRVNVKSQMGGWVQANPWLATGTAKVILSEVNSNKPSELQGYVELAGDRAAFVLANPSGIAINGGGFINASTVTLTTGTVIVNAGSLESYRVQGGTITVDGAGLNTRDADYTAVLSRAVQVNAGIWAKQLQVLTGANDIQAASVTTDAAIQYTRMAAQSPAPAYALDVPALGGMYAGKIHLIGTEAGLGVNNAGLIQTSQGSLTLSHDGWLSNSGTLQAATQLKINTTGALDNSAVIYAGDALSITSAGPQTHSGITAALGQVQLQAQGPQGQIQSTLQGLIAAGVQPDGNLASGQDLSLDASAKLQLLGQTVASQRMSLSGTGIDLSQGQVSAVQAQITASSEDLNATQSRINIAQTLQLSTPQTLRTDGANIQGQTLQLQASSLSNVHGQLAQQGSSDLIIRLAGGLDNTGGTLQSNGTQLSIQALQLTNNSGQILHAGTGQLSIQADTLTNASESAGATPSPGQTSLGHISSNGPLSIQSQAISNAGTIYAAGDSRVLTTHLSNSGSLYTAAAQSVTATGTLTNSGTLAAQSHNTIQTGQLSSTSTSVLAAGLQVNGTFATQGDLQVNATQSLTARGQNIAAGSLSLQGQRLDLQGSQTTTQHGSMQLLAAVPGAAGSIQTVQANILSAADLDIQGQGLNNTQGTLQAAHNIRLNVTDLDNTQGQIHANQNLTLQIKSGLSNSGNITANQDLNTSAASLGNSGTLYAGGNQSLTVNKAISNSGTIAAGSHLNLQAASYSSSASSVTAVGMAANGQLTGTGTLTASTTGELQSAGQVLATNGMSLTGASLNLAGSTTGTTAGDMALSASSGDINTSLAQISTPGQLTITANSNSNQSLNNTAGRISAQTLNLQAGQDLSVQGSNVLADQGVNLSAGRNVRIEAAQNTSTSGNFNETKISGLFSSGGLSITLGKQQQSLDQKGQSTTAAASTVGSTGGNVTITAGQGYTQTGSDILTPGLNSPSGSGSIAIAAKTVHINEARETGSQSSEQKFKQSGLTLAVTSPVISALQTAGNQLQAAGNTGSGRMQALAAANVAMNAKQAATQVQDALNKGDSTGGAGISISVGASSSQALQSSSADTARGSSVTAGGNITIQATGDGANSNLTVQGSDVKAAGTTTLKADNQVNLLAAQNTSRMQSQDQQGQSTMAAQLENRQAQGLQWSHRAGSASTFVWMGRSSCILQI